MALTWGPAISNSVAGQIRVGLDPKSMTYVPDGPLSTATTGVTYTWDVYMQARGAYEDPVTITGSGDALPAGYSATALFADPTVNTGITGATPKRVGSTRQTIPLTYSKATRTARVAVSDIFGSSASATHAVSISVPARPVSPPEAPSGVQVTRSSDTRHTVNWTRNSPGDVTKPYVNVEVQRWDHVSGTYVTVTTTGNVSSWTDTSTVAGRQWRYRVRAKNSGGASAWAYSGYFYTSPPQPSSVKAVKSGGDITLTWVKPTVPGASVEIAHSTDNAVSWVYPGWTSSGTSYLMKQPDPAQTHRYAVRTVTGTLASAYVWSNNVQLLAPPAAPTGMEPAVADAQQPVTLSWEHQPVDTTAQTARELRWRAVGETAWNGVPKAPATGAEHIIPAGTWPPGTVEWQVRTWGDHADPSPWSALTLTAVTERPSATLTEPTTQQHQGSRVTARWDYFDPEGSAQAAYRVALYASDGTTVLWERSRVSTIRSASVEYRLQDGMSYVVGVQAQDAVGLWSAEARQQLDVAYAPPPAAVVQAQWDESAGAIVVAISHPAPAAGEVEALTCELWRATAGGEWLRIAAGLPLDTSVVDPIPAVGGTTWYRVVTVSALPSTAQSPDVAVPVDADGWIYLSTGPGWSRTIRVCHSPTLSPDWGQQDAYHHMAGRRLPFRVRSEQQTESVGVAVSLAPSRVGSATYAELHAFLSTADEVVLYRDPTGRRLFGGISGLSGQQQNTEETASFTVVAVDYVEEEVPA